MVYGKLIFNNIKDYTPSWIKTVPYAQSTKPTFVRKAQVVSRFNADPKVKRFWRFFRTNVANYPFLWHFVILFNALAIYGLSKYPWLTIYVANNENRTIEYAIARQKAHQKSLEAAEE